MAGSFHWKAPAGMLGGLIVGILFAVGHHAFYNNLSGQEAPSGNYTLGSLSYSKQEANIQIGTALAFLTKSALTVAVVIAYAQLFWRSIIRGEARKGTTLNHLDIAHSVLENVFYMFQPRVWVKRPVSFLLALIVWLIPIAAIIPSGTLSVTLASANPSPTNELHVRNLDYANLNFLAELPASGFHSTADDGKNDRYFYNGPSQSIARIADAVAAGGAILPISPPAPNASWDMSLFGPALKCAPVSNEQNLAISRSIANHNFDNSDEEHPWCAHPYGYLSWTAGQVPLNNSNSSFSATTLSPDGQPANLFVVTAPGMWEVMAVPSHIQSPLCTAQKPADGGMGTYGQNSTMLQCHVYNTTYHLGFEYENGEQSIAVKLDDEAPSSGLSIVDWVYGPSSFDAANCSVLNRGGEDCNYDQQLAKSLSYQAITDAFNRLIVGSIAQTIRPTEGALKAETNTSITSTSLLQSPELEYLRDGMGAASQYLAKYHLFASLQSTLATANGKNGTVVDGAEFASGTNSSLPLQNALEQMFQNLTISLMSLAELQPNTSSADAPLKTIVTLPQFHNVYQYAAWKLWLAYGLAIFFGGLSVIMGLITMFFNGASYSSDFSTITRVARFAWIEPDIRTADADGKDPLPGYLEDARLMLFAAPSVYKEQEESIELRESQEPLARPLRAAGGHDADSL